MYDFKLSHHAEAGGVPLLNQFSGLPSCADIAIDISGLVAFIIIIVIVKFTICE